MKPSPATLVVADAGPLIGLARIERLDLLRMLFRQVIIPEAVAAELCMGGSLPGAMAISAAAKRGWLKTVSVSGVSADLLAVVDRGEAEAITYARRKGALLLIDEAVPLTPSPSRRGSCVLYESSSSSSSDWVGGGIEDENDGDGNEHRRKDVSSEERMPTWD